MTDIRVLRVLIIEDEALIALLLEDVLLSLGHEVCASERTEAGAIAAAAKHHPELIIADAHLQEGSGICAVNAIMKAGFIPHLFVSGDMLKNRLINPAAGILQKPFDERQLIEAIHRAVAVANVLIGEKHARGLLEC